MTGRSSLLQLLFRAQGNKDRDVETVCPACPDALRAAAGCGGQARPGCPARGGGRGGHQLSGLWLEDSRRNWYYASFRGPCPGIQFGRSIAFDTRGSARFDKYTRILVGDAVCDIERLVTADKPLPERERRRLAKAAREELKARGEN